ncbi:hypothetical protein B0H34DRAFT_705893 [Crassisporium funariophilum]|nr:hypothetical protein B0H34DRAFT_705893 [Crassisporium funariophilum]
MSQPGLAILKSVQSQGTRPCQNPCPLCKVPSSKSTRISIHATPIIPPERLNGWMDK